MRAKSILLLLLALGCGLVASIGITQVIANKGNDAAPAGETRSIFVAMKDIPMGDVISPQAIKAEPWPADKVPEGAFDNADKLKERRAKAPIVAGSPILEKHLIGTDVADQGPSGNIPKGMRVVPVKVDPTIGSTNVIRVCDFVDVLMFVKGDSGRQIGGTMAKTILQKIKVFAVNDQYEMPGSGEKEKPAAMKTVWLLVTPEQAQKLMLAAESGQVRLVIRNPNDDQQSDLVSEDLRTMLGGSSGSESTPPQETAQAKVQEVVKVAPEPAPPVAPIAAPEPPKPNSWSIRILAGSQVSETVLDEGTGDHSGRWKAREGSQWTQPKTEPPAKIEPAPAPKDAPEPAPHENVEDRAKERRVSRDATRR